MKAIVVSFDHLPVGFLGLYGNTWVDTPGFNRLAAEGVVFDAHLASDVSVTSASPATETWGTTEAWAETLREQGVRTALLLEEPRVRGTGDPRGLDEADVAAGEDGLDADAEETPFARLVDRAARWLRRPPEGEWLLWLKSRGVPDRWLPPREFAARYVELFEDLEDEDFDEDATATGDFEWIPVEEFEPEEADESEDDEESAGTLLPDADDRQRYVEIPVPATSSLDFDESEFDETELDENGGENDADGDASDGESFDLDEAAEFDELLRALAEVGLRESTDELETADWLLVRAVYAGYVSLLDRGLGRLRAAVSEAVDDDVLFVVVGAMGESLGERAGLPREYGAFGLGEERVHTPLLVCGGGVGAGVRRRSLCRSTDLAASLLAAFGIPTDESGWWGIATGGTDDDTREVVIRDGRRAVGLRTSDAYLIRDLAASPSVTRLYVKPEDVWDLHDVSAQDPEIVERLSGRLGDDQ